MSVLRVIFAICLSLTIGLANPANSNAAPNRDEMIGQMLMMGFTGSSANSSWPKLLASQIRRGEVGGVVMLGYNFKSKRGVNGLTSLFKNAAGARKVFIAVDMEGGSVQRLGRKLGYPAIPSARSVARKQTLTQAKATYSKLAAISKGAGFNMNLGPVVDLLINPRNPVISKWKTDLNPDKIKAHYQYK